MRTEYTKTKWQDRVVIRDGKPKANFKPYVKARMTREEIEAKRAQIKEQEVVFDLEVAMLEEAKDLRDKVLAYLDETVTLDEFLDDLMNNGLCQRIGVWSKR